jgi:hypothetical protein
MCYNFGFSILDFRLRNQREIPTLLLIRRMKTVSDELCSSFFGPMSDNSKSKIQNPKWKGRQ